MNKAEANKLPKITPMLAELPAHLKDHANFQRIRIALLDAQSTGHSHGTAGEWGQCPHCMSKRLEYKELLSKLGFKSPAQYQAWKKVHDTIDGRITGSAPLKKYNT